MGPSSPQRPQSGPANTWFHPFNTWAGHGFLLGVCFRNGGNDLLPMSLIGNIIAIEMQLAFRVHMGVFSGQSEYSPDPAYVIPSGCPHQTKICP